MINAIKSSQRLGLLQKGNFFLVSLLTRINYRHYHYELPFFFGLEISFLQQYRTTKLSSNKRLMRLLVTITNSTSSFFGTGF